MNTVCKAVVFAIFSTLAINAQANEHHHGDMNERHACRRTKPGDQRHWRSKKR
ncbi:periplasmic copper-binding protein [Citrobacter amalonaticus]|nr:periplasmic copper-binding protein [Citrobacter amalonaticus]